MSGILLDTHVVNDLINGPDALSTAARSAIRGHTGKIYASAATAMELADHAARGHTRFAVPVAELDQALQEAGVTVLPVRWDEFAAAAAVSAPGCDTWDRILIATAAARDLTIVTADEAIRAHPGVRSVG